MLPNELITKIFLASTDSLFSRYFYKLMLVNRSFRKHLLSLQSAFLNTHFKTRPDLLFSIEPYRSWAANCASSESTVISLLRSQQEYWREKVSKEIELGWDEPSDGTQLSLPGNVDADLKTGQGSAHRLVRLAVKHSKPELVRYMFRELGASVDQNHLYFIGHKDMSRCNPLWHVNLKHDIPMLRMLVHEFELDVESAYDGYTAVYDDYVRDDYELEGEGMDREVLWLMVEGGGMISTMINFYPNDDEEELRLFERNRDILFDMFCNEERTVEYGGVMYQLPAEGSLLFLRLFNRWNIRIDPIRMGVIREIVRRGRPTWSEAKQYALENNLNPVALFNQNLSELFHRSHSLPYYLSPSASRSLHHNSLSPARSLRARRNLKRKLAHLDENSTDPHDDASDQDDLSDIPASPIKHRPSPSRKFPATTPTNTTHHHNTNKPRGRRPTHYSNSHNRSANFNPPVRIATNPSLYTGSFPTVVVPSAYRYALRPEYNVTARPPPIRWDGLPLDIPPSTSGYTLLTPEEIHVCRTLRIQPGMYLTIKEHALATLSEEGWFRKNQMQRMFRMNVNKSARLYDWFKGLRWIPPPRTKTSTPPPAAPAPVPIAGASSSSRTHTTSSSKSPQRSFHSHDGATSDALVTAVEEDDEDNDEEVVEMDEITAVESKGGVVELVRPRRR
ncbi:hypothetical protein BJ742DRAFT_857812 [Cladochytrium replicatum]|nr:hypothetical protein BJ742DRAFT_857812 [Cladochytrium replicatum]